MTDAGTKHWFLQPSMEDPFYFCGGWQIFNRAYELFSVQCPAERITYRHREPDNRYLDDIPPQELRSGIVWVYWSSHLIELAARLPADCRVVFYAMNTDYGPSLGQRTPREWPIAALSRYIAADYALRNEGHHIVYLGAALHPQARNPGRDRDIDVLFHRRKCVPYVTDELAPRLQGCCRVETIEDWLPQPEFLGLLKRAKVYLYWTHEQIASVGVMEGLGMQPIEAIACGAQPAGNIYAGLSDYMEPAGNCLKIGTHSVEYDVSQILRAVAEHPGSNPGEEKILSQFGEGAFSGRLPQVRAALEHFFDRPADVPASTFDVGAVRPTLKNRPVVWLYRRVMGWRKRIRGQLPR